MSSAGHQPAARIAILVSSLGVGGAQRMMVNLANRFSEIGHPVDLLTVRAEGAYREDLSAAVNLRPLPARHMLAAVPAIARYLRREKPAAMVAALTNVNIAAIVAGRLAAAGTRITVSERNHLTTATRNARGWRQRILPRAARAIYPLADGIVGISEGVVDDLASITRLPRQRLTTIYNPVVTPSFAARVNAPVDHPWLTNKSAPVIVASGRLVPQKDYPTLLRAFQRVVASRDVRLLVLGEGPERAMLQGMAESLGIASRTEFHGFIRNPLALMQRCDVFAISSAWEGFGNVLVEALYCGLPVVATDCPSGPAEILAHGTYGALVPVGDADAFAAALLSALETRPDPETQRNRANQFSVEAIAEQYLRVMLPTAGYRPATSAYSVS